MRPFDIINSEWLVSELLTVLVEGNERNKFKIKNSKIDRHKCESCKTFPERRTENRTVRFQIRRRFTRYIMDYVSNEYVDTYV